MKIQYKLGQKDIVAYNEYYYNKTTPFIQKNLRWILLAIFIMYMISTFRRPIPEELLDWGNWVIFLFVGGVLYFLGFKKFKSREKEIQRFIIENPDTIGEREVEIREDFVIYKTDSLKTEYQYHSFKNCEGVKDYFLLNLGTQNSIIIPERAFRDRQHFEEFKSLIEKRTITNQKK